MSNFVFSLNTTMPVFLMMVLGIFLSQIGLIDDGFASKLNKLACMGQQIRSFLFCRYGGHDRVGLVFVLLDKIPAGTRRIRSGGLSKQCGDSGYRIYAEHVRRRIHGSAHDHRQCSVI